MFDEDKTMILPDLLNTCAAAVPAVEAVVASATQRVRDMTSEGGRVSGRALEEHQYAAHGLSWFAQDRIEDPVDAADAGSPAG